MSRVRFLSPAPIRPARLLTHRPTGRTRARPWNTRRVTSPTGPLVELAAAYGVMTAYVDWRGQQVQGSAETIEAVPTARGADVGDPDAAREEHALGPWRRMLPPCVVTIQGAPERVPVHVPHGSPAVLQVHLETGEWRTLDQVDHWVEPRDV